jgi:ABC-type nitrate/sulfonate/bicarbonate transport system ATPase subunit
MATGPGIEISIREKRFASGGEPLFDDFTLSIAPGTVMSLVGPSGVGKSTLLRIIAGVDTAYDGEVRVGGTRAEDAPSPGFVFQEARLLPWLTALDNICAVAPDMPRADAQGLLARVGLEDVAGALPHELSGGMQRRVALVRAVAPKSGLLLLDEPFVSLERSLVNELQNLFLDLIEADRLTVVLVTHIAEDAMRLCDRVVTLAGRPATIVSDVTPTAG